jgi:CYTH domain-containing protein
MAVEIERKYLVVGDGWRADSLRSAIYRQGYLAKTPSATVRIRREDDHATLTVKGPRRGIVRQEFSYPISCEEAEYLMRHVCIGAVIEKVRHFVPYGGMIWHVDVFGGRALGLTLAEIELDRPDQLYPVPPWVGAEVTQDPRYRTSAIALAGGRPYGAGSPEPARRPLPPRPEVLSAASGSASARSPRG